MIYMLSSLENNNTGMIVAKMIIKPPIVGVPDFSIWPFKPRSLMFSPICLDLKYLIIDFPKMVEINSESMILIDALNEI